MNTRIWIVWTIACVLWSSTFLFIKIGLATIPPFTFAAARLVIAAIVLGTIVTLRHDWRDVPRHEARHILGAGLMLLGLNYALVYWGAQFIPSGVVAILQSAQPTLALIVGAMLRTERLTLRRASAVVAGMAGTCVIFATELRLGGGEGLAGVAAVAAGAVCVALSYSWLKKHVRRATGAAVAALQCATGVLPLTGLVIVFEGVPQPGSWPPPAWAALLYLALAASVAAFWLNYWLLRRMTTSAMLMMGVAEVPLALLLGRIVLDEPLRPGLSAGAALIAAGVALTVTSEVGAQRPGQPVAAASTRGRR
jgi:drug/metabolite transporter (DMT)-like permease